MAAGSPSPRSELSPPLLVRFHGDAVDLLIDPFDGGRARFEDQAQELLDGVYGASCVSRNPF